MRLDKAQIVFASVLVVAFVLVPQTISAQSSTNPVVPAAIDWPNETLSNFKSVPYIKAAIELQTLGKNKTCEALRSHITPTDVFNNNIDVFVLCRMLFVARSGHKFRRPMVGAPGFLGHTTFTDWSLEPITISDGVPFAITMGYDIGGLPEPPLMYLDYCMKNCDWNSYKYTPKTKAQLEQALNDLLDSPPLNGHVEASDRDFFASQIR